MTTTRTSVGRSRVIVEVNDNEARRVFVRFADVDNKKRSGRVLAAAKTEAPVKSGALRASLTVTQSRETSGQWATGREVSANTPYAGFVTTGTAPHTITGRPLLAFFWPVTGTTMVVRSVQHPGTTGNNFLQRALRKAR